MKNNSGALYGKYPAEIVSYDQVTRTCRVSIPGITDGGDVLPNAEIMYPVGDKSKIETEAGKHSTELEILAGDLIWVEFIGGDQRYPLIVGYRNPSTNNALNWRRYHHANIEMTADGIMRLNAAQIELNADDTIIINCNNAETGAKTITINATHTITHNAEDQIINADTDINGSTLTHNSKSVGDTHKHSGVQAGGSNTGDPI
jgi:phage gp45-like